MLPPVIALNGVARGDPETVRETVRGLLDQSGWILDSTELASGGVCFAFQMVAGNLEWFSSVIADSGFQLDDESRLLLEQSAAEIAELPDAANVRGTLEMTFVK